uniref:Cysteine string protein n=1 Tax=Lepeophtheirus salmonis TaxID=72036 RepID=D3PK24_LEPSM|nr:Cysteine string protein [Lepeophtheirus salmonis]
MLDKRKYSTSGISLFNILGVAKGSPEEDVRKAYRKKALQFHPDKNRDNPEANEIFKDVNRAYHVLTDPEKREIYDKYGSLGLQVGEQFGYKNVKVYMLSEKPWAKVVFGFLLFIVGVTCVATCCCCCLCCGKCSSWLKNEDFDAEMYEDLKKEQEKDKSEDMPQEAPPHTANFNYNSSNAYSSAY